MSDASTYDRRWTVAQRIQRETGVHVEPVHPAGPIGIAYVVGDARIGMRNAAEARRRAKEIAAAERAALYADD